MTVRNLLLGVALAGAATVAAAQVDTTLSVYAKPDRMVSLSDGRRMNLRCSGSGSPAVVLEAGGDPNGSLTWSRLYPKLAAFTRVCSYDRAGIMYSDPGSLPRTTDRVVSDLHELLAAAHEKGPYVLVGHSLGGVYARAYATRHPADVAALVLLDGSVEGQWPVIAPNNAELLQSQGEAALARCVEAAENHQIKPGNACFPTRSSIMPDDLWASLVEIRQKPDGARATLSEAKEFSALAPLPEGKNPAFADKPLRVLYVAHPEVGEQGNEGWTRLSRKVAGLSFRGELQFVANSGHYIQRDQPDVAAQAIHEVWREVRR